MSGIALTITKGERVNAAPIGCGTLCRTCARCVPLMWALGKWVAGWSTPMMRDELRAQSFSIVCDHYTGISTLTNIPWLADLIARRLGRCWRVTTEQLGEANFRLVITNKHNGGRDEFVLRVSDDSMYAARYMLHAVLSIPPDVFGMVATSFGALVER
jgi:hypothetical protein